MKNLMLFVLIVLITIDISAQDFSVTPYPVHEFEMVDEDELVADAVFRNNSNVEKTYVWERTVLCELNVIETWFCDPNVCYTPAVSTQEFTLAPGIDDDFNLHVRFSSLTERALTVQIKVYEKGNEANVLDVIYDLNDCATVTSVEDVDLSEINLFPNPTADNFTLTNTSSVRNVIIHNTIGTPLKQYLAEENTSYSISDLPAGVYMVQLIDNNGDNVGTKRVFKQ